MGPTIRTCLPFEFKGSLEYSRKGFTGVYSGPINEFVEYFERKSNMSIEVHSSNDGMGEFNPKTGYYGGCVGRLQQNQSDFLFSPVTFPLDAENIQQGQVVYPHTIQTLGIYYPRTQNELSSVPIESCFRSFSKGIWFACLATAIIVYLLQLIRQRMYLNFQRDCH